MNKTLAVFASFAARHLPPANTAQPDVIERAKLAFSEQLALTNSIDSDFEWVADAAVYQYRLNDLNAKRRPGGHAAV